MHTRFLPLLMLLMLAGCATPVGLSILGGGTSAMVSHNLNGNVTRTFTSPLATVRQATLAAFENMGVALEGDTTTVIGQSIRAKASDRSIEVEFERLSDNLTVMRATARRAGFLRDNATATEVISQTERAMAVFVGDAPLAARSAAVIPAAAVRTASAPLYAVNLENIPAGSGRSLRAVPARLQDHLLYTTESQRQGRRIVHVNLGYFISEADANEARRVAAATFPDAAVVRIEREQNPAGDALPAEMLRTAAGDRARGQPAYF